MAEVSGSFLGKGWQFPPSFTARGGGVLMVEEEEDIHQSLQILLTTSPGERTMLEGFGCDLSRFVFEEISQGLINALDSMIKDAILYYEPRITVIRVRIDESKVSVHSPLPFPGNAAILAAISAGETPALPEGGERLQSKDTAGMLLIGIEYKVKSTNSRFNMVFPFYSNEAIQPGT